MSKKADTIKDLDEVSEFHSHDLCSSDVETRGHDQRRRDVFSRPFNAAHLITLSLMALQILIAALPILLAWFVVMYTVDSVRQRNVANRQAIAKELGVSNRRPKFVGFFHPYW